MKKNQRNCQNCGQFSGPHHTCPSSSIIPPPAPQPQRAPGQKTTSAAPDLSADIAEQYARFGKLPIDAQRETDTQSGDVLSPGGPMVRGTATWQAFARLFLANETAPDRPSKARMMAHCLHLNQTDHNGEPYIEHCRRTVDHVAASTEYKTATPEDQASVAAAAWLHDSVEDTDLTLDDLRQAGFSALTVRLVDALTVRKGESRLDNYQRIADAGPLAVCLKLADNSDNIDPARRAKLPGAPGNPVADGEDNKYERLGKKYAKMYNFFGRPIPSQLAEFAPDA